MVENTSKLVSSLPEAWVLPENPDRVIPTYRLIDEDGVVLNEAEFPKEVCAQNSLKKLILTCVAHQRRNY